MKCPNCQAELLPVDGVMFCLQCGRAVQAGEGDKKTSPALEDTTDPLLQKAITDSLGHEVKWKLPVAATPPPAVKSFASLHHALAAPRSLAPAVAVGAAPAPVVAVAVPVAPPVLETVAANQGTGAINLLPAAVRPARPSKWQLSWPGLGWTMGMLAAGVFIVGNLVIYSLYSNRVYPGVKVGQVKVGGIKQSELPAYLQQRIPENPDLTVDVGGSKYVIAGHSLGVPDVGQAGREAMNVGHNIELPLAGLISALVSKPITVQRLVNQTAVRNAAVQLAGEAGHDATEPVPMIVGNQAFVIGEKNGEEVDVDQAATSMARIVAAGKTLVSVPKQELPPVVTANDYQDDISAAQTRMGLEFKITIGTASYSPNAQQIGSWLVFAGPGRGVTVNQPALASYVTGLPGGFDRKGVYDAMLAAVGAGQSLNYVASTKVTAAPHPSSSAPVWPLATYRYCLAAPGSVEAKDLNDASAATLADAASWGLGGRVKFEAVENGCNFTLGLVSAGSMGLLDQRCGQQSTCRLGDQLEINLTNWQQPPPAWKTGAAAYRTELINHEVGHWLGFEHAGCLGNTASTSVLQAPTLVLDGCSPNWFADTADQSEKVLPGF